MARFSLPFESKLEVVRECSERWLEVVLPDGKSAFIERGDVLFKNEPLLSLRFVRSVVVFKVYLIHGVEDQAIWAMTAPVSYRCLSADGHFFAA